MTTNTPATTALQLIRNRTFDELAVGDTVSMERTLNSDDIALFAIMSGDINPQHLDPEYAASTRFHGVIAHGMWGAALISALLGTRLPGPGTIYLGQTLRFLLPVRVGDTLTVRVTVSTRDAATKRLKLACDCVNQNGKTVIEGEAEVIAPTESIVRPRSTLPELRLLRADGLAQLLDHVQALGSLRVAVVHPCDELSLTAALDAHRAGLIVPLLVGPTARIRATAEAAGLSLTGVEIEDVPHSHAAAARAAAAWLCGTSSISTPVSDRPAASAVARMRAVGPTSSGTMRPARWASSAAVRLSSSQGWTTATRRLPSACTWSSSCPRPSARSRRSSGRVLRGRTMDSVGAITSASPSMTVLPFWLTQSQASLSRLVAASRVLTVTRTVSVSPTRTGSRKRSVWPR